MVIIIPVPSLLPQLQSKHRKLFLLVQYRNRSKWRHYGSAEEVKGVNSCNACNASSTDDVGCNAQQNGYKHWIEEVGGRQRRPTVSYIFQIFRSVEFLHEVSMEAIAVALPPSSSRNTMSQDGEHVSWPESQQEF